MDTQTRRIDAARLSHAVFQRDNVTLHFQHARGENMNLIEGQDLRAKAQDIRAEAQDLRAEAQLKARISELKLRTSELKPRISELKPS